MNTEQLINEIRKLYPDNTGEYLFKSCSKEWIVVLKKVEGTVTNQSRLPLDNLNRAFAKYRANKLFVVDIINKSNPSESVNEIYNSVHREKKILYTKGKIIECVAFDENLDKTCSDGIHFYETIDCAFYLEPSSKANDKWIFWHGNGQKKSEGDYINGKKHGKWTIWNAYAYGQKASEGEYINGKKHGKWTIWNAHGQKYSEGEYINGKENGKWTYWHESGQIQSEYEYLNGVKNGKWTRWYDSGEIFSEGEYLNGERNGKLIFRYENGQKKTEVEFVNGKRHGKWTNWHSNGQKKRRWISKWIYENDTC